MENLLVKLQKSIADRNHRKLASLFDEGSMDFAIIGEDSEPIDLFAGEDDSECDSVDLQSGMIELLAVLRALNWMLQHAHWQCAGINFYGNHLLFERLYEDVQAEVDTTAEKTIGYFGTDVLESPQIMSSALDWVAKWEEESDTVLDRAIQAYRDVQEFLQDLYEDCDDLPLGLDDMLQSVANKHDEHMYLIQSVKPESQLKSKVASATRIKSADLWSLAGLTVANNADNTLVNIANQDFWAVKVGEDGQPFIERLIDTDII
tara:strand:+ start:7453 stop:8238 length:786 start_codon:yes stop_codon:yes gene_type:complete